MAKVFRLYTGGSNTFEGWNENPSFPYNFTARNTINDPDGASAKNEITSIPSPFARIDLVKTAFREVNERANNNINSLDDNTIFHKMVSDTLDIGEIFFNIDKYKDKIEVITWDVSIALENLRNSGNVCHANLADVLDKYMQSDAAIYNFDSLKNIYLLNYKGGTAELNIIGATSPATLFFSNANNLEYVKDIFFANNDRPFDADYQPLYKRDLDYLKSWWVLKMSIPNFSSLFPELEEYLSITFKAITDQEIRNQLRTITAANITDFQNIELVSNQQNNQVEVNGYNLLKKKITLAGKASS